VLAAATDGKPWTLTAILEFSDMKKYFVSTLTFILISCSSAKKKTENFYSEDKNVNLFAFVGKKISVTEFDPNAEEKEIITIDSLTGEKIMQKSYVIDSGFSCKYLVIKNVYNLLEKDTVEFVAYDHYGRPDFEKSEYALLYISKSSKENYYFHQKYQYDDLKLDADNNFYGYIFKLKNNTWIKEEKKVSVNELFNEKKKNVFKDLFK
jgi:hypothetical protein